MSHSESLKIENISHPQVNWQDGMQVSQTDFVQMEQAWADQLRDTLRLGVGFYSFGLIPSNFVSNPGFETKKVSSSTVRISLIHCRALTPGGHRIEFTELLPQDLIPFIEIDLSLSQNLDLFVEIDPDKTLPFGPSAPKGYPRVLNCMPQLKLFVAKMGEYDASIDALAANKLKIAELSIDNTDLKFNPAFIPACVTFHSHSVLWSHYQELLKTYNEIVEAAKKVMIKYRKQKNLEDLYYFFAEGIFHCTAAHQATFVHLFSNQPPIHLCVHMVNLANVVNGLFEIMGGQKKESLDLINSFIQQHFSLTWESFFTRFQDLPIGFLLDLSGKTNQLFRFSKFLLDLLQEFGKEVIAPKEGPIIKTS